MNYRKTPPPNQNEWERAPIDIKLYIALRLFLAIIYPSIEKIALQVLHRVDLWLFPPAAFFAAYNLAIRNFPDHPIKMIAVLSTAFMCAALVLMIIRPRNIKWIKVRR
jgi:hypothetical protein